MATSNVLPVYVTTQSDVPKTKHWAILVFSTISIPGYDRTDPPDSKQIVEYLAYTDQGEWVEAIKERTFSKRAESWQAIVVDVPEIKTTVTLEVQ